MENKIKILAFAGSLRKNSYNKSLINAAKELLPPTAQLEIFDLEGIPLYNEDKEEPQSKRVKEFKKKIEEADAILIASPEYNKSVTSVLKAALEWGSRPAGKNSFSEKAAAIMSASEGPAGGLRSQVALRYIFVDLNLHAVNRPEVYVPFVDKKLDSKGNLTDEKTRERIKELLVNLVALSERLKRGKQAMENDK